MKKIGRSAKIRIGGGGGEFLAESLKAKKISKKDHSVYNRVSLKKSHSLYEPQFTEHRKKYTLATQAKTLLTLQIFQQTCFWLVSEKKYCTATFLDAQKLNSRSAWKANVFVFLYISVRKNIWWGAE